MRQPPALTETDDLGSPVAFGVGSRASPGAEHASTGEHDGREHGRSEHNEHSTEARRRGEHGREHRR